jgi:superfamily II DNA/RNA helicase
MRQLSINSYALLMRHCCPGIGADLITAHDRIKAAAMWHFVHTAGIDQLERMTDEQFRDAVTAHGYSLPPQELPAIFSAMTAELRAVNDAFVETESEGIPLDQTTATSQISNQSSSG